MICFRDLGSEASITENEKTFVIVEATEFIFVCTIKLLLQLYVSMV